MTSKQKVFALAAELNAKVEIEKDYSGFTVRVEAPERMHWEEGVHEIVAWQFSGFNTEGLWKDVLERMQEGIVSCDTCCEWW